MTEFLKVKEYNRDTEKVNSISHFVGAWFSIILLFFFIKRQVHYSFYLYAIFLFIMFLFSGLYHASPIGTKLRRVLRIIDHSDIYTCILGTYLPICLIGIENTYVGHSLILVEIICTLIGVLINSLNKENKALKVIAYIVYIIGGWACIVTIPLGIQMKPGVFEFVLLGGIAYTVGAILYAIGKKCIWFHSVFHMFVLLGALLQFIGISYLM
ncbi:MAG: hemolysin III family protein [Bacilli bacterium]|nr:hemolysin III family protein [Bacilli bacterium]